jgi:hypothetical protein
MASTEAYWAAVRSANDERSISPTSLLSRLPYVSVVMPEGTCRTETVWPSSEEQRSRPTGRLSEPDPAAVEGSEEERLAAFRRIRDEIRDRVKAFYSQRQN